MIINFGKGNGGGGSTGGGIPEAPKDGKLYGRKDATWSEAVDSLTIYVPMFANAPDTGQPVVAQDIDEEMKAHNTETLNLVGKLGEHDSKSFISFQGLRRAQERISVLNCIIRGVVIDIEILQKDLGGYKLVKAQLNPNGWTPKSIEDVVTSKILDSKGYATTAYVDEIVGTANNRLNLI